MNSVSKTIAAAAITAVILGSGLAGCDRFRNYTDQEHVQRAKDFQAKGELRSAEIELKNALTKNPKNAEARWLLGEVYVDTGRGEAAQKELEHALALGVGKEALKVPLGKAYLLQGAFQKVLDEINTGPDSSAPNAARIYKLRGDAQWSLRQPKDACALYQESRRVDEKFPDAYWGLSICAYYMDRDPAAAKSYLDQALALDPKNSQTWAAFGNLYNTQGKLGDAEKAFAKAIESDGHDVGVRFMHGLLLLDLGKIDQAEAEAKQVEKLAPGTPRALHLRAGVEVQRRHYHAAADAIDQLLKVAPNYLPALFISAQAQFGLGNLERTASDIARFRTAFPDHLAARHLQAVILIQQGKAADAVQLLKPLLELEPPDVAALGIAGEAYARQGEYSKASEVFEKAASLAPDNTSVKMGLSMSYLAGGQAARALPTLELMAKDEHQAVKAGGVLVSYYLAAGQTDKALLAAQELEKTLPKNPLPAYLQGLSYLKKDEPNKAHEAFERALELDPKFLNAASRLAELDLQSKKPEAAKNRFLAILEKDKNNLQAMLALAQIARLANQESDFVSWLEKAVAADPAAVEPRSLLARYYLGKEKPQRALAIARDAAASSSDPAALDLLATVQLAAGEKDNALASVNKLAAENPDSIAIQLRLAAVQAQLHRFADARATLTDTLQKNPGNPGTLAALVAIDVADGKSDEALHVARQLQKAHPEIAAGFSLEGDLMFQAKNFPAAGKAYEQAANVGSGLDATKMHKSYLLAGARQEADQKLLAWMKAHPEDLGPPAYWGSVKVSEGDYKTGAEVLRKVVDNMPGNLVAANNLAIALQRTGDIGAARTYAERAYQMAPTSPELKDTLGWILVQQGDLTHAKPLLADAAKSAAKTPAVRYHYAVVLFKSGDKVAAKREAEAAVSAGKPFEELNETKTLLKQIAP